MTDDEILQHFADAGIDFQRFRDNNFQEVHATMGSFKVDRLIEAARAILVAAEAEAKAARGE